MGFYEQTMLAIRNSEWKPVLDPRGTGYLDGLNREREYEFRRWPDESTTRFRLSEMSPYFNVCGLYWRDPDFKAARHSKP